MQRLFRAVLTGTLVVGASGLALVGTAGSESVDPQNGSAYPILQVKKVVTGTATTGFTVTVSCTPQELSVQTPQLPDTTLTFTANGTPDTATPTSAWASVGGNWQFQNSSLTGQTCTVQETVAGGATSTSYACAFTDANAGSTSEAPPEASVTTACSGSASGPTVVHYPTNLHCVSFECSLGTSALVTVTNTFPVITAVNQDANSVLVTGSGFPANTEVTVDIQSTPLVLGKLTADANGAFSKRFTIPCSVGSGSHTVTATAATGQKASTGVTLAACPVVAEIRFTG